MSSKELEHIKSICMNEYMSDGDIIDHIDYITCESKDDDSSKIKEIIGLDINDYTDDDCIELIIKYIESRE